MINLIRAELRKMLTVRTTYMLGAGAVAIALLTVFAGGSGDPTHEGKALWEQQSWFFTTLLTRLLFVLLGVRIVTEEYRYGTLTPTLIASGSRLRLLAAKFAAAGLGALALAALAQVSVVVGATVFWAQRDVSLTLTTDDATAMVGMAIAAALYGALGVGLGFIVRQPVPASVGAVVWLLLGEELLHARIGDAVSYLPGYAGLALAVGPEWSGSDDPLLGATVLLAWTALALMGAAALVQRRDVG